jgi:hypothetical protein
MRRVNANRLVPPARAALSSEATETVGAIGPKVSCAPPRVRVARSRVVGAQ